MNLHCIAFLVYLWFNIDGKLIRWWILAPLTAPKPDLLNKNVKNYVLPRGGYFTCKFNLLPVSWRNPWRATLLSLLLTTLLPDCYQHFPPNTLTTLSLLSTPPPTTNYAYPTLSATLRSLLLTIHYVCAFCSF